jgi:hypothetical protein
MLGDVLSVRTRLRNSFCLLDYPTLSPSQPKHIQLASTACILAFHNTTAAYPATIKLITMQALRLLGFAALVAAAVPQNATNEKRTVGSFMATFEEMPAGLQLSNYKGLKWQGIGAACLGAHTVSH